MSEPRVTITLGRSGQKVVKMPRIESGGRRMEPMLLSGGKRPADQRNGNSTEGILFPASKRVRGEFGTFSPGYNAVRGAGVARNDLRLKLMRKELLKRAVEERKKRNIYANIPGNTQSTDRRILRHASPTKIAGEILQPESFRKSYPSYVQNAFSPNSQNGVMRIPQEISPPRHIDKLQQLSSRRPSDASRTGDVVHYVLDRSRAIGPAPITVRATHGPRKLVMEPSSTSGMENTSYSAEQPLSVSGFLHSLGLGKYTVTFQAEEVDLAALKQMEDQDLKELGIPMGPRKKILLALPPRRRRHPL